MLMRDRYQAARSAGRPLIGGHRGNPAEKPENTLASFESAIASGVDLIECDVHLSFDGDLIVIHDHTVDRTTDGSGMVRTLSTSELRALDAGQGERLPLLEEVLDVARGRVGLAIEIKQAPLPYPGLEEVLLATLGEDVGEVAVISFHHPSILKLKLMEPRLQTGLLEVARPVDPIVLLAQAKADIHCAHYSGVDPELVTAVHEAGGWVGVWTVDDAVAVAWSKHCGVDSVFTNRPAEIGPLLRLP
ncbi:MAG TPA: glycerophosphodiester phosphodiesterase family protein [Candidatus Dormibacteraeota bacterium]|jgi:glycerophosphoryl diester phosphodiesterase|nr:glycerophosphodiester phosphodiesterase family protein [Candidatus Dormibacteraeota bacterium]